nr:uncharacterized protein LOC113399618 [Vanessa tameamea]
MCEQNSAVYANIKLKVMLIGVITFIICLIGFSLALYVIILEEYNQTKFRSTNELQHVLDMEIDSNVIDLVAGIAGVIFLLATIFSVLLLIGIHKNKPGFVLAYFGYSTMLTMLLILSAILELIQSYWALAIPTLVLSTFYIPCLMIVHTVYEMMQKGLLLGSDRHNLIENESLN